MSYEKRDKALAIIRNHEGKIFLWQYILWNKSWTLPKWSVDAKDNDTYDTLYRELREELCLQKEDFILIKAFKEPYIKYSSKSDVAQRIAINWADYSYDEAHYFWFLLDFIWEEARIDITSTNEFSEYKWVTEDEISEYMDRWVYDFFMK